MQITIPPSPTCLIIDDNPQATDELTALLHTHHFAVRVWTAANVPLASDILHDEKIDLIFIRIKHWDECREILNDIPYSLQQVVFLSGRLEKCTYHLPLVVDFHLQPPYQATSVNMIFRKLQEPGFRPRPLDFFFLKVNCRFHVIYFTTLRAVSGKRGVITVQTATDEYTLAGTLSQFQKRLPNRFTRVNRNLLMAHKPGGDPQNTSLVISIFARPIA